MSNPDINKMGYYSGCPPAEEAWGLYGGATATQPPRTPFKLSSFKKTNKHSVYFFQQTLFACNRIPNRNSSLDKMQNPCTLNKYKIHLTMLSRCKFC